MQKTIRQIGQIGRIGQIRQIGQIERIGQIGHMGHIGRMVGESGGAGGGCRVGGEGFLCRSGGSEAVGGGIRGAWEGDGTVGARTEDVACGVAELEAYGPGAKDAVAQVACGSFESVGVG